MRQTLRRTKILVQTSLSFITTHCQAEEGWMILVNRVEELVAERSTVFHQNNGRTAAVLIIVTFDLCGTLLHR